MHRRAGAGVERRFEPTANVMGNPPGFVAFVCWSG